MEKEILISTAQEAFKNYPNEEKIFITPDGMVFLSAHGHDAIQHANKQHEGVLFIFTRKEVENSDDDQLSNEETPTIKWKKEEILSWLEAKGNPVTGDATKEELLKIVAEVIESKQAE